MNLDFNKQLGRKLREVRQKRGETLESLSQKVGLSHQQMFKYEHGESKISSEILFKISQLLAIPLEFFFENLDLKDSPQEERNPKINPDKNREKVLRVLLVEDDPDDVFILDKIINQQEEFVELYSLNDGETALKFLKKTFSTTAKNEMKPNIILLDLNIPGINGSSLLRSIKTNTALRHIPVIIMTSSLNRKDMEGCYAMGASGYICKAFDYELLKHNIHCFIQYWRNLMVLPD